MRLTPTLSTAAASAALMTVSWFGAGPALADDTYDLQETIDGCELQGSCPDDDTYTLQETIDGCELQGGCRTEQAPSATSGTATGDPAAASTPAAAALEWARAQMGSTAWDGLCQRFVRDAYLNGAGIDIGGGDAIDYWNSRPDLQHQGDTNPIPGSLVYWGPTPNNPYGHVAIAVGGDTVISSLERSSSGIHEFSLADRNSTGYYPYLGWIAPA